MLVGFQLQLLQDAVNYLLLSGVNRRIASLTCVFEHFVVP